MTVKVVLESPATSLLLRVKVSMWEGLSMVPKENCYLMLTPNFY